MKLAYLLLVHKNPGQVNRLIERLNVDGNGIFIHADKKNSIEEDLLKGPNIFFVENPQSVQWGGYSQIQATLSLCEAALDSPVHYDYHMLISGQDYPIKPDTKLKSYLKENKGKEFFKVKELPVDYWRKQRGGFDRIELFYPKLLLGNTGRKWRVRKVYVRLCKKVGLVYERSFFKKYYGITNWFCASREALVYLVDFAEKNAKGLSFFRHSLMADEIFFNSIIMNSHFKDRVIPTDLRQVDWTSGPEKPLVWKKEHYERLLSSPAFFARKFDETIDAEILDMIDAERKGSDAQGYDCKAQTVS